MAPSLVLLLLVVSVLLGGCLEQIQSPRLPEGTLHNFLQHLEAGELDDARSYFAPGLVTPSADLDAGLQASALRLSFYTVGKTKPKIENTTLGQVRVTLSGAATLKGETGAKSDQPAGSTQEIITARLVERGPGWRILDYSLICCPLPK